MVFSRLYSPLTRRLLQSTQRNLSSRSRESQRALAQEKSRKAQEYAERIRASIKAGQTNPYGRSSTDPGIAFASSNVTSNSFTPLRTFGVVLGVSTVSALSFYSSPLYSQYISPELQESIAARTKPIEESVNDVLATVTTDFSSKFTSTQRLALDPIDTDYFPIEPITVVIQLEQCLVSRTWSLTAGWRTAIRPGAIELLTQLAQAYRYVPRLGRDVPAFEIVLVTNEDFTSVDEYTRIINHKVLSLINPAYASRDMFVVPMAFKIIDRQFLEKLKKEDIASMRKTLEEKASPATKSKNSTGTSISSILGSGTLKGMSGQFAKQLEAFPRDPRKIVVIDTDPLAVSKCAFNSVLIPAYTNNQEDEENNRSDEIASGMTDTKQRDKRERDRQIEEATLSILSLFFRSIVNSENIPSLKRFSDAKDVRPALQFFKQDHKDPLSNFDLHSVGQRLAPIYRAHQTRQQRQKAKQMRQLKELQKQRNDNESNNGSKKKSGGGFSPLGGAVNVDSKLVGEMRKMKEANEKALEEHRAMQEEEAKMLEEIEKMNTWSGQAKMAASSLLATVGLSSPDDSKDAEQF
eukprot:g2808.t1